MSSAAADRQHTRERAAARRRRRKAKALRPRQRERELERDARRRATNAGLVLPEAGELERLGLGP